MNEIWEAELATYSKYLDDLADLVGQANINWWKDPDTGEPISRNAGELIALIHSEVSEALEGQRKGLMDDHLPEYEMHDVELVDAVIRILDVLYHREARIGSIFRDKMLYNSQREDHKPENRLKDGGKKF